MDTNSIRLDAMKKYCEMAIRLERETDFWNSMADQAERKMQEYKKEHIRQNRLASEAQSQLNMMENYNGAYTFWFLQGLSSQETVVR